MAKDITNHLVAGHIGFRLAQGRFAMLVDNGTLGPAQARDWLLQSAEVNEKGGPINKAAAKMLRAMADGYALSDAKH